MRTPHPEELSLEQKIGIRWRNIAALIVFAVGLLQMVGEVSGLRALKGLGAATAASPFPKVFSDVNGLETFASEFIIHVETTSGQHVERVMTPEVYHQLKGPYNRRNVYGAALSYAPRLPDVLWQAVFCYGLNPEGPLRRELGLPTDAARIRVVIRTKTYGRNDTWVLSPSCAK